MTFAGAVSARFGFKPTHVFGLLANTDWAVGDEVTAMCPDCAVPYHLVMPRDGTLRDGAVVCSNCGWAEAVKDLDRAIQREIRSQLLENAPTPSPRPQQPQLFPIPKSARAPTQRQKPSRVHPLADLAVDQLESELRADLRGRRLVCEVPADWARRAELKGAIEQLRDLGIADDQRLLSRRYPAITSCFLVAAATYGYAAGNLYDNLPVAGLDGSLLGRAFERALIELGLERFDAMVADGALRYVAPILGHAGIPEYCCDDYLGLVLDELQRGTDDATEMLTNLRLAPSRLVNIDKPVGRFLLHGGSISRDYLDRTIEMVQDWLTSNLQVDAAEYGLPTYVWEALAERERSHVGNRARRRGSASPPRPSIFIDPWDPTGPSAELPPVPRTIGSGTWRISSSDHTFDVRTSNLEERSVALPRSRAWTIDLIIDGAVARRSQFVGLAEMQGLLFDGSGALVRDPTRISLEQVLVLAPSDAELSVLSASTENEPPRVIEELPDPSGDWTGFLLRRVDLSNVRKLTISRGGTTRSCWVSDPVKAPTLVGATLDGVVTADGLAVYTEAPELEIPGDHDDSLWSVKVIVNGITTINTARDPDTWLAAIIPPDELAEVEIVGRGPLGSDFRSHFVVVPGLAVARPSRVILPGESRPTLGVFVGESIRLEDQPFGAPMIREIREIRDRSSVEVSDAHRTLQLSVALPLLTWSLSTEPGAAETDTRVGRLVIDDLLDDAAPLAKVRCGKAGVELSIEVESRGEILYASPSIRTSREGRWAFDLNPAKDALRASTAVTTNVRLRVDGLRVLLAELRQDPGVTDVDLQTTKHGQVWVNWSETRRVTDRVVRLWPLSRPWETPIVLAVDNDASPPVVFDETAIPAGTYVAEVAVDDGWTAPRCPRLDSLHVCKAAVGKTELRSDHPLDVIAHALETGRFIARLEDAEVDAYAREILVALEGQILLGLDPTTLGIFQFLCQRLAARPQALARVLDDQIGTGMAPDTVLALTIELTPFMGHRSAAGATPSLWSGTPALAACLDLASDDPEAPERLESFAGIEQLDAWTPDTTAVSDANMRVLLGMDPNQLRMLRTILEAVPLYVLDPDSRQTAAFEWVIADRTGEFDARRWVSAHRSPLKVLPVPEWAESLIEAERLSDATTHAFPESHLPALAMRAACCLLMSYEPQPRRALQELRQHAPLIVARALTMAVVVDAKNREQTWPN